jgi:AmiR/NasT family two-component response regulator
MALEDAATTVRVEIERQREVIELLSKKVLELQTALDSRIVIEQAKGMLAVRLGVTPDEAFADLRQEARSTRTRIHDVAAAVVATHGDSLLGVSNGGREGGSEGAGFRHRARTG